MRSISVPALVAAALGLAACNEPAPAPPSPPPAPPRGTLRLLHVPEDATVQVDGEARGVLSPPYELALPEGSHLVRVDWSEPVPSGLGLMGTIGAPAADDDAPREPRSHEELVEIVAGETVEREATGEAPPPPPPPPPPVRVWLASEPPASVSGRDGAALGTTPLVAALLPEGVREVTLTAEGAPPLSLALVPEMHARVRLGADTSPPPGDPDVIADPSRELLAAPMRRASRDVARCVERELPERFAPLRLSVQVSIDAHGAPWSTSVLGFFPGPGADGPPEGFDALAECVLDVLGGLRWRDGLGPASLSYPYAIEGTDG